MKKIKILTYLTVLIMLGSSEPVFAQAVIDASQIIAKTSEWTQKITDATNKISQQAMQGKLITSQGFNFSGLIDVNQLLSDLQQSLMNQPADKQMNQVVAGSKEKNRQTVAAQKDAYGAAAKEQYAQKLAYTDDNISQTQAKHAEYQNTAVQKCRQKEQAKVAYESETNEDEKSKKLEIYTNLVAECEDYETRTKETAALLSQLKKERAEMQKTANKIGTDEDAQYHAMQMREDALSNQEENLDFYGVNSSPDTEWDSEDFAKAFQLGSEEYKKFYDRYFYNPQKVSEASGSASSDKRLAYQSTIDRVMRERRYLLVNSAAHLLQVSATVRREIPVRTASIEKVFKNVPSSSGELEAMLSYAATRVENARTLLLYAKLLSAKIQYMAAADLLDIEAKKTWEDNADYTQFDLGRYILTDEYVKELAEEYNKTINHNQTN